MAETLPCLRDRHYRCEIPFPPGKRAGGIPLEEAGTEQPSLRPED